MCVIRVCPIAMMYASVSFIAKAKCVCVCGKDVSDCVIHGKGDRAFMCRHGASIPVWVIHSACVFTPVEPSCVVTAHACAV